MPADQGSRTLAPPMQGHARLGGRVGGVVHTRRIFAFFHTVSTRPWPPWPCPQPDRPSPLLQQERRRGCGLNQC